MIRFVRSLDPYWVGMTLAALTLAGLYITQLDETMGWGDDWGVYLNWARNLSEGLPYNYRNLQISGAPGYAVLLAATGELFSWSFADLKILQTVSIALWGMTIFGLGRRYLDPRLALAVALAVMTLPFLFKFQHELYSDLPAAFFIYAALWSFTSLAQQSGRMSRTLALAGVSLACAFAALTIRISAATAILAIMAAGFWIVLFRRRIDRRQRLIMAGVTLSMAGIYVLCQYLWPSDAFYDKIWVVYQNSLRDGASLIDLLLQQFQRESTHIASIAFYVAPIPAWAAWIMLGLAAIATGIWLRRGETLALPAFLWIGTLILWLTPWQAGARYQLMTLPALIIAACYGLQAIVRSVRPMARSRAAGMAATIVILALWTGHNIRQTATHLWGQPGFADDPIHHPDMLAFTQWLRTHTGPDDVLCGTYKMRIFLYLASRPVCAISPVPLVKGGQTARDFIRSRPHAAKTRFIVIPMIDHVFDEFGFDPDIVRKTDDKLRADPTVRLVYDGLLFHAYEVLAHQ